MAFLETAAANLGTGVGEATALLADPEFVHVLVGVGLFVGAKRYYTEE